jgi:predicted RNase H-like nuclease
MKPCHGAKERLCYKASKVRKYWPDLTTADRLTRLYREWRFIAGLLDARVQGVAATLGEPSQAFNARERKAHEDRIDAVVCAWVGTCVLEGKAEPFGDTDAAIWIPFPVSDADATA